MKRVARVITVAVVVTLSAATLPGCMAFAPAPPDVVGSLGLTVDEDQQPILIVQTCDSPVVRVDLHRTREGLAPDQENEAVGAFTTSTPVSGIVELALHQPEALWEGEPVTVGGGRGYIATGATAEGETLRQVTFYRADLADLGPGTVYTNGDDAASTELVAASDFALRACARP